MNVLNAITIAGIEIPGWTLETALFWLFFAIVVITVFMIIVFAVLLRRVGKRETIVVGKEEEEPETVDYMIVIKAPEGLPAMQIALYNGGNQQGKAVPVTGFSATIAAVPGNYAVKLFGLPEEYTYVAGVVSETERVTEVTITKKATEAKNEPSVIIYKNAEAPVEAAPVAAPVEEEKVNYEITVVAPENLNQLQVALFSGELQVGAAVTVVNGSATIAAVAGDYAVKTFGVPEGYEVESELLSAAKPAATVTITAVEEQAAEVEEAPVEEPVPEVQEEVAVAEAPVEEAAPIIIEEEAFEGGTLRYDKSFKARFIQSSNEIKNWYTEIKNELMSYKKVKSRLSWKRESYNIGRNLAAKLSFRGETLCIYLPLDPNEYQESKFKVESIEDNASYADTPCLYRIKNDKRARYAKELIAIVMENLGIEKASEHESVDYYEPYEGLVQLINKGLIKRNIKNKAAEAIFVTKKEDNE